MNEDEYKAAHHWTDLDDSERVQVVSRFPEPYCWYAVAMGTTHEDDEDSEYEANLGEVRPDTAVLASEPSQAIRRAIEQLRPKLAEGRHRVHVSKELPFGSREDQSEEFWATGRRVGGQPRTQPPVHEESAPSSHR